MDQERWRELASEYLEGTLTPPMQEAVEAHLHENPESRAEAEQLRALFAELKQIPEVEPPLFFAENVMTRIQREAEQKRPWWASFLGIGRTAGATLILGSAVAGIAWMFLNPQKTSHTGSGVREAKTALLPGMNGSGEAPGNPVALSIPHLSIERTLRVAPGEEPAYDFALKLEKASTGTARFELPGDSHDYRVVFDKGTSSILRVPLISARSEETMALRCDWSSGGDKHVKFLVVPLPSTEKEKEESLKLSFGLGEMSLPETARSLTARYGRPITLEDVPEGLRLSVVARAETLEETLRRHLSGTNLRVTSTRGGVLVAPAR